MEGKLLEVIEIFEEGCGIGFGIDAPEDGRDSLWGVVRERERPVALPGDVVGYELEVLWVSGVVVSSGVGLC